MNCSACGQENPDLARFCLECGSALRLACDACGAELPVSAKFCLECGHRIEASVSRGSHDPRAYTPRHLAEKILRSRTALEGERKQVTVLFADLEGSMDLAAQLDPEVWHRILDRFFDVLTRCVHRFEGTVNQYTGDGIMALFGAPIAHEDHAQRACYAALQIGHELQDLARAVREEYDLDLATRIGLNSGEVVVGRIGDDLRMDYTARGLTVGLAQRMEQLAEAGRVNIGPSTAQLVEGFFELEDLGAAGIKGSASPVRVYALGEPSSLRTRFDRARARGLSPFVGRDDEMRQLESCLERAVRGQGQVIGMVAEAGTGKSRLCFEFTERCRAQGLVVLQARALAHGKSIPLRPMLEMFRQRFGIEPGDDAQSARQKIESTLLSLDAAFVEALPVMFDFLGVPDPERKPPRLEPEAYQRLVHESFKRIVYADSRDRTVVTLIEDLHWLDESSDQLVAELVEVAPSTRGLVLLNFRPEYTAPWMSRSIHQQIVLQPLDPEAARQMVQNALGRDPAVADLAAAIYARTRGNPFFAEEIVQSLLEDGALEGQAGSRRLERAVGDLPLPESAQSLVASRIDRLEACDKEVLQLAAVVGREFSRSLVRAVGDLTDARLDASLRLLREREFLYETALYPEAEFTFKHPLTHEVAYRSLLADRRSTLHRRVAHELEILDADHLDELAADLAWHWEAAGEQSLAARWNCRAAEWAQLRDPREATRHWEAAAKLIPELPETEEDGQILIDALAKLLNQGWRAGITEAEALSLFERGDRAAERFSDVGGRGLLRWAYGNTRLAAGFLLEYRDHMREARRLLEQSGDEELQLSLAMSFAAGEGFVGGFAAVSEIVDDFFERAPAEPGYGYTRSGFDTYAFMVGWRMWALSEQGKLTEALQPARRIAELVRSSSDPTARLLKTAELLRFGQYRGELEDAMELAVEGMEIAERYGVPIQRVAGLSSLARAHALQGRWQEAAPLLEQAIALASEEGAFGEWEGFNLATLATAYLATGCHDKARETAERGARLAQERGSKSQELENRVALARAEAALGNNPAADREVERCEQLIADTGAVIWRPHLAEVRAQQARNLGDETAADEAIVEALRLFTEMGATGHVARLTAGGS